MEKQLPRGIRNNNPLNIRVGNKWLGEVENPTDKDFEQFKTMLYGLRAGFYLLKRYIKRYKLCTIKEIISRWAPESENNTKRYVESVSRMAGIGILDEISFEDVEGMCAIVSAMCYIENGQYVDADLINEAYWLVRYNH